MMRRPSSDLLGALLIVVSASCFGLLGPIARYADTVGISSLTLVTWRAGVGAIVVILFMAARAVTGNRPGAPVA